ncbi:MAG: glycerol-3-phosphate acyltransferase [Acidimicrobiales bacterium]
MNDVVLAVVLAVAAYLAGSFPTASVVGMLSGHDHSKEGSGNPGASNVWRTSGATYGLITVVVDVAKGLVPVLATLVVFDREYAAVVWATATFGHVFPLARWRRGGKGVATAGGGSLPLFPIYGLMLIVVFVVVVKLTKRASVGSLLIAVLLPVGAIVLHDHVAELIASFAVAALVVARHRANIGRLLSGDELKV